MKKWILYTGIGIVILSLIGNYVYFTARQLPHPIILKHYYSQSIRDTLSIRLHYLVNRNDEDIKIKSIEIPEIEYASFAVNDYDGPRTYRHQILKTGIIQINQDQLFKDKIVVHEITAHFSNGETQKFNIGEITIQKNQWGKSPLNFVASGGSNDHSGFNIVKANENVKINNIMIPFSQQLKGSLTIRLNNDQIQLNEINKALRNNDLDPSKNLEGTSTNLFPLSINRGELLGEKHQFSFEESNPNKLHYYQFDVQLIGEKENNEPFSSYFDVHYDPHYDEKDIRKIVDKIKGE